MLDPITVSVLTHRFDAIVQEMGEAMLRTAYSQILNSSRDFSTAICDAGARLVAQAEHVPIHVGAIPWAVESVRDFFQGRIRPGDVYLLNDPYHGNNHLPDLTAFVPVFVDGEVGFWSINRAHQSDIGGSTHGAYNPAATEIWQEGLRITPLKLYDAGELRDDVLKMVATNVRHPHDFMGDLRAMIGSARVGERRLQALLDEYGPKTVVGAVDEILDRAEKQARDCVRTWRDGVYRGESILDDDGHGVTDIWIRATVTKRGDALTVDLSDSHAQVRGFINSSFRIAIKGVNPRTGRPFIWHMFHARPGGGACAEGGGWETAGEGQAAGGIKFGSVEVAETRFPLTFEHHEFRADSGGDGMHRGGVGAVLRLRMDVEEPAVANTAGDGVRHAPYGLLGGQDGLPHRYRLLSRGRRPRVLKTKEVGILVRPGDVFLVESSGGGGFGPPSKRPPETRARDLENGFVTRRGRAANSRS